MPVVGLFLDPEAMEVQKNFKDLRKLGVQNIAQYSATNVPFPADFSTEIHFFHTIAMFIGMCGPPQKLSLALVPHPNILHIIMKLTYYMLLVMNVLRKLDGWFKPPIQQALVTPH